MARLNAAVIGLGDGGLCSARALSRCEHVRVVAICDLDSGRLEAVSPELAAARVHTSVEQLASDSSIDVAVVATPDANHLLTATALLTCGKHVFVEKPLATSISDLRLFSDLDRLRPGRLHFSEKYSFAYPVEAALATRDLGDFMTGVTSYTMWQTERIMGGGKWRTETAYNPCAGGLSHNFMTALFFARSPITHVRATGNVLTYHENLDLHRGFDTMEGTLRFASGRTLSWLVCLAARGPNSPYGHRTVSHVLQFRNGVLAYGPEPADDRLIVGGRSVSFTPESGVAEWPEYNVGVLYRKMHEDIVASITAGRRPRHTIAEGINVAAACALAFESAHADGGWQEVPLELRCAPVSD